MSLITIRPFYRILIERRTRAFLGFPSPKCFTSFVKENSSSSQLNLAHNPIIHTFSPQMLGFRCVLGQKPISTPSSILDQSRVFSSTCNGGLSLITRASLNVRNYSTSVETRVNENNFERLYVQGGLNVKPVVVERIDKDEDIGRDEKESIVVVEEGESLNNDNSGAGLNEIEVLSGGIEEETAVEREAWRLLKEAVVTYCGSPVGTLAASDPADKLPLNYDQVFIRDFVPSALAFLLKGEGEIVRDFLLHTLQLQVIISDCFYVVAILHVSYWFC